MSADGRTVCVLIRGLNSWWSRSIALVVRSDALASGQINMRKVDGWQTLATAPIDQPSDLVLSRDSFKRPAIPRREFPPHSGRHQRVAMQPVKDNAWRLNG
ncbi:hypothetical protein V1277_006265 [Bradyrhizobium sp. AZCC 1588]|uniref:hypothetical protein n=1 Tax=unclassified Bradyrhizobium TaxID=2631580 RepID=UPI002FEEA089